MSQSEVSSIMATATVAAYYYHKETGNDTHDFIVNILNDIFDEEIDHEEVAQRVQHYVNEWDNIKESDDE